MRSFTLSLVFLLSGYCSFANTIYYVRTDGTGSGLSWSDASPDLMSVLAKAEFGDEIWVAAGTYSPSKDGDRKASFCIRDGVKMYGGFTGSEYDRTSRDWGKNPTVLSGEIGNPGIDDNSYNVVFTQNVGPQTVIDGFVITLGNANGEDRTIGSRVRAGGGWYDLASDSGNSKPAISNCTFVLNHALEGGAFYANGFNGSSSPSFRNCSFFNNKARLDGGSVYCDGRGESTNVVYLFNCIFQNNYSSYGAGIYYGNGASQTTLMLEKCIFKENKATSWGGGISYTNASGGFFDFQMNECRFEKNYPTDVNKNLFLSEPDQDLARR